MKTISDKAPAYGSDQNYLKHNIQLFVKFKPYNFLKKLKIYKNIWKTKIRNDNN